MVLRCVGLRAECRRRMARQVQTRYALLATAAERCVASVNVGEKLTCGESADLRLSGVEPTR
jgi:hypothetical protein